MGKVKRTIVIKMKGELERINQLCEAIGNVCAFPRYADVETTFE